ncbi:unnamed protein product [Ostreobium quekettii]|uniref:DUF1764-domain-containing protein n=1 Tax=Ostreobium quekettii TaxID=121088 RepID=A0A8S1IYN4_9CHLO|nr:unnamed protein product [Ostreobium quekettii]|eukprot:evm.model.scf_112.7 EVM.evm.TU.scf_112.7   scf_112:59828-60922(+)
MGEALHRDPFCVPSVPRPAPLPWISAFLRRARPAKGVDPDIRPAGVARHGSVTPPFYPWCKLHTSPTPCSLFWMLAAGGAKGVRPLEMAKRRRDGKGKGPAEGAWGDRESGKRARASRDRGAALEEGVGKMTVSGFDGIGTKGRGGGGLPSSDPGTDGCHARGSVAEDGAGPVGAKQSRGRKMGETLGRGEGKVLVAGSGKGKGGSAAGGAGKGKRDADAGKESMGTGKKSSASHGKQREDGGPAGGLGGELGNGLKRKGNQDEDLDAIFAPVSGGRKRIGGEVKPQKEERSHGRKGLNSKRKTGEQQCAEVVGSKDDIFGKMSNSGGRKRTKEGYRVYGEDELRLGVEGGDTALCPFDCDCCF